MEPMCRHRHSVIDPHSSVRSRPLQAEASRDMKNHVTQTVPTSTSHGTGAARGRITIGAHRAEILTWDAGDDSPPPGDAAAPPFTAGTRPALSSLAPSSLAPSSLTPSSRAIASAVPHARSATSPATLQPRIALLTPPPSAAGLHTSTPTGAELHARQIAVQFMRTGRLPRHGQALDRETATQHYLALRTIKVALRESDDNKHPRHNALAQLIPLASQKPGKRLPVTARSLSRRLRRAHARDPAELEDMLEPIFGREGLPEGLLDLIADSDDSDNGEELTELLADACDLPGLSTHRRRLLELADDAEHDLLDQNRHRIFASLNTQPQASETSDPTSFQDAYCELVHGDLGFCGTFRKIVELFGAENLRSTLKTLWAALGDDMRGLSVASSHHSREYLAALHSFVTAMSNLSQITVVLDHFTGFLDFMTRRGTPTNAAVLLKGWPDLFEPGTPSAFRFQNLCDALDLARGEQRAILLNELGSIFRTLPDSAFRDAAQESDLLRRAQLVDAAVSAQEGEQEFDDPLHYTLSPHEQKLQGQPVAAPGAAVH